MTGALHILSRAGPVRPVPGRPLGHHRGRDGLRAAGASCCCFFGMLDFGRLGYQFVFAAERRCRSAARIAAVRPPACPGVPDDNYRGTVAVGHGSAAVRHGLQRRRLALHQPGDRGLCRRHHEPHRRGDLVRIARCCPTTRRPPTSLQLRLRSRPGLPWRALCPRWSPVELQNLTLPVRLSRSAPWASWPAVREGSHAKFHLSFNERFPPRRGSGQRNQRMKPMYSKDDPYDPSRTSVLLIAPQASLASTIGTSAVGAWRHQGSDRNGKRSSQLNGSALDLARGHDVLIFTADPSRAEDMRGHRRAGEGAEGHATDRADRWRRAVAQARALHEGRRGRRPADADGRDRTDRRDQGAGSSAGDGAGAGAAGGSSPSPRRAAGSARRPWRSTWRTSWRPSVASCEEGRPQRRAGRSGLAVRHHRHHPRPAGAGRPVAARASTAPPRRRFPRAGHGAAAQRCFRPAGAIALRAAGCADRGAGQVACSTELASTYDYVVVDLPRALVELAGTRCWSMLRRAGPGHRHCRCRRSATAGA